jgi:beta-fructofuranosidase
MLRHKNNFIGDTWYYVNEDTVHCYYLTCPTTVERHTAWDIGHAVSKDLINWTDHQIVLRRGKLGDWDDTCLATGSVIKHEGRFWMAYTAKWDKPDVAVGIAVSDDLYHWEKVGNRPNR